VMAPLVRRELIHRVGLFDEDLRTAEDWDYWIRCARAGTFGYLPGAVAVYRKHASQLHTDSSRMFAGARRVIEKHFRADPGLYGLALACFYWSYAKRRFRSHDYLRVALCLVLSEYYSRTAGGVPLSVREVDTVILPVAAAPVTDGLPERVAS
jgi:GT2 family glycosyltransferase